MRYVAHKNGFMYNMRDLLTNSVFLEECDEKLLAWMREVCV